MNVFKTIWQYGYSYCVIYTPFARAILFLFALIIVAVALCLWTFSDDYYIRNSCNTFTLAEIVSVDTMRIYGDPYRSYEYSAKCVYYVSGKEYSAKFSGFKVSPPVGLKAPVYYNSDSPDKYTFYGEFKEKLLNDPFFYYVKQVEGEKKKSTEISVR